MNGRFTRQQRLLKAADFSAILEKRCCGRGVFLQVCAREGGQTNSRLGIVVPKRHVSTAVGRNFAKRLLRESFRLNHPQLPIKDYVVRVQRAITASDAKQVREELLALFHRAKRCRDF